MGAVLSVDVGSVCCVMRMLPLLTLCACSTVVDGPMDGSATDADVDAPGHDAGVDPSLAPYDTCAAPLDVSGGGTFLLDMKSVDDDYPSVLAFGCGGIVDYDACRDAVATFQLDEAQDVDILADPGTTDVHVTLALKTSCDGEAPFDTASGYGATPLRHRALPAGTYFLFIGTDPPAPPIIIGGQPPMEDTGRLELSVTFGPATAAATNESCAAPLDIGTGGHFEGSFVDVTADVAACGPLEAPDLVYTFTTQERANLHVVLQSTAAIRVVLRPSCGAGSYIDCFWTNVPFLGPRSTERTFYDLPAGTWFLTLESSREPDFTLDVDIGPATLPPTGDACAAPAPIEIATPFTGSLATMQEDFIIACGSGRPDAVHQFTLSEPSDVWITARGTGGSLLLMLTSSCEERGRAYLQCTSAPESISTYMAALAPGTYYVVVAAVAVERYELTVEAWPPQDVAPVSVGGNESCATAFEVPAEGGVFTGDTTGAIDDTSSSICGGSAGGLDVAFRWTTTSRRRVFATTAGSGFTNTLQLRQSLSCSELTCDGWSGGRDMSSTYSSWAALDADLPPGTYTFVVDGGSALHQGPYRFELRPF